MAEQAFDDIVVSRIPSLLRTAYLLCRDRGQAEDLVQEALLKSLRRWRRGGPPEHPEAYLRRVVLNEYLSWRRRRASTEVVSSQLAADQVADDSQDTVAGRDAVWRLLGALSPRARAVLVLRYYDDLSDRDIAAQLGCAEATVRSIAARALSSLRAEPELADILGPVARLRPIARLDPATAPVDPSILGLEA